jgi:hypothetical protein
MSEISPDRSQELTYKILTLVEEEHPLNSIAALLVCAAKISAHSNKSDPEEALSIMKKLLTLSFMEECEDG